MISFEFPGFEKICTLLVTLLGPHQMLYIEFIYNNSGGKDDIYRWSHLAGCNDLIIQVISINQKKS